MSKLFAFLLLFVAFASSVLSQPSSSRFNAAVTVGDVEKLRLPAPVADISFFDGKIHFVCGGMLLTSSVDGMNLSSSQVDTSLTSIDPRMSYAVRDPYSGSIYYTKKDSKGVSQLYEYYQKKSGKYTTRRVKLPGLTSSIIHPVFTADGRAMVFVCDSPLGFGGTDLWFSLRNGDEWLSPQNMGHIVNSGGDELMPVIYDDFLIFSSNGRPDSYGGFDLYASRLVALSQGDTVMMYPVGRCPVHSMQAPFCSVDDDLALLPSDDNSSGWWLRRAADSSEVLYPFDGRLECVALQGRITSARYEKLDGAYAVAANTSRPGTPVHYDTVYALDDGSYTLYLRVGLHYDLLFHAPNHFISRQEILPSRTSEESLFASMSKDVQLKTIPLDSLLSFSALFSSSVSSELSPAGRANVDKLAQFLVENPDLKINVYSFYNLSSDIPFCSLLNESRLRSLTDYLVSKGVDPKSVVASTNVPISMRRAASFQTNNRSLSPVAQSSLTAAFSFTK